MPQCISEAHLCSQYIGLNELSFTCGKYLNVLAWISQQNMPSLNANPFQHPNSSSRPTFWPGPCKCTFNSFSCVIMSLRNISFKNQSSFNYRNCCSFLPRNALIASKQHINDAPLQWSCVALSHNSFDMLAMFLSFNNFWWAPACHWKSSSMPRLARMP